jgi:hypothetical protein
MNERIDPIEVLLGLASLVAFLFVVRFLGVIFRAYSWAFFVGWLLAPILGCVLGWQPVRQKVSSRFVSRTRVVLMTFVVISSFSFFADYDQVRDRIGHSLIAGYSVYRSEDPEVGENGSLYYSQHVSARHWYSRWGLKLAEFALLAACIGIPYLTWQSTTATLKRYDQARTA